ncbi:DEDD exonuclease domain-containing protein [Kineococcus gynurae]|uniref:DEDD exonuclease domain-containing protein n=1 Tax=Kineococcus gynurae TaxID=452979 RepID=A0ABV5LUG2_9ACTN
MTVRTTGPGFLQTGFDELGRLLSETTFVVVDLETTGGPPAEAGITEIGAVKVRGGEVLGEFQTLVRPPGTIPAYVQALTGITTRMVAGAPSPEQVLPSFLEFARGAVLVAHNASYDTGFLAAACRRVQLSWPAFEVVDTVALARRVVDRDEARNHRLGTLAALFGSATTPDHRALTDARATVDVLHALLGRLGNRGVHTVEDLRALTATVAPARREKRHLAVGLPSAPGVYQFRDAADRVLYVGTSVDVRRRVGSYFTAAETRARMTEMVRAATRVVPVVCETPLEARVREVRLIAEHEPPYNRRSRRPDRVVWLRLTDEAFPRLSITRSGPAGPGVGTHLGPFRSSARAELARAALHEAIPLRRCTRRLARRPRAGGEACVLLDLGRCGAPCLGADGGGQDAESYAGLVAATRAALAGAAEAPVRSALTRMRRLAEQERFEEAAEARDRLEAYLRAGERAERRAPLTGLAELVAARRSRPAPGWPQGGWELVLIRFGRLAGTTLTPRGADPMPYVRALQATGEVVAPGPPGTTLLEETDALLGWLEQPGTRLVETTGAEESPWTCPVRGAGWARAVALAAP